MQKSRGVSSPDFYQSQVLHTNVYTSLGGKHDKKGLAWPGGFPGGSVAKTPRLGTPNARDPGFDPWPGMEIPHATTETSRAAAINKRARMTQ